jgi:pilus assembly protein CpaC
MSFTTRQRPRAFRLLLAVFIILVFVASPQAQVTSYSETGAPAESAAPTSIDLLVGRSTVLNVGTAIARLSLTVPDVADAMVTNPQQILIHGKAPGTISLFVWEKSGAIRTYEITVRRDLSVLSNQLRHLFPGETISVSGSGKDVVLSGRVSTPYVVEKAAEVAIAYAEKKENVVNLLKMQEGVASNQVMLKVRFAEVSRSALQELGASYFANGYKDDWYGSATTQQYPSPTFDEGRLLFSDFLNLFVFNAKEGLGTVIKALSNKGLFQSLAEPNLVAIDGKEASFLAGGEYPFPVVTPTSAGGYTVTIMFKEFGVRLHFTPTILGDEMVRLKVRPEVSSLDFTNAIVMEGFRVPALSTRRTETEVELRNGQTFAIAGLMNNTLTNSVSKIPGLGDIPILGALFRSKAHQKNQTELVVIITPYILRRNSVGVSEGVPNLVEPYLGAPHRSLPPPSPYIGSPRYGGTEPGPGANAQPGQQAAPAIAAPAAEPVSAPVAPAPAAPAKTSSTAPAAATAPANPQPAVAPEIAPGAPVLTKADRKRMEKARKREQKEREGEAKRQAEAQAAADRAAAEQKKRDEAAAAEQQKRDEAAAKAALQKAEEESARLEAAAGEQARRDAEAAQKAAADRKKAEEQERKLAAEEAKRQQALAEAAAKLKDAQSAYEAIVRNGSAPQPLGVPGEKRPNDPNQPQP